MNNTIENGKNKILTPYKYNKNLKLLQENNAVELGANYLKLNPEITDGEISQIFDSLITCSNATLFWIGDFLNSTELTKGEAYARAYQETDYAPQTLWNCKNLCKRIPADKRLNISFAHHKEALAICGRGNEDQALRFLRIAELEKMTVKEMRVHIRVSLADKAEPDNTPSTIYEDKGFIQVMDSVNTIIRYLNNLSSGEAEIKKTYLRGELEKLTALAAKKLK